MKSGLSEEEKEESRKQLRLKVMMSIRHPEEYYERAAKSLGIETMRADEINLLVATMDAAEADIRIDVAYNQVKIDASKDLYQRLFDMSPVLKGQLDSK